MRTIKQLPAGTPIETDLTKFPDSTILNATDTADGTPVVREIYGDVLTNLYKLLRLTKVVATGIEDNEVTGYQLITALQKLANKQNDIEQQLNLTGTVFSITLDLSILPDKYFCWVKAVEDYAPGTGYTFKGSDNNPLAFTSPGGFLSGDEVLLIIDRATVRAYSLNALTNSISEVFTVFGTPVAYNDSTKIWYQSEGVLYSDNPEAHDLQEAIRVSASDGTLLVYEMIVIQGFVLCLVFAPATLQYKFYRFAIGNLSVPLPVTIFGTAFPTGSIANDYKPNIYTDGTQLYITNNTGGSANNYALNLYLINMAAGTLTNTGSVNLNVSFQKTTNVVIKNNYLYTFAAGILVQYNLGTGAIVFQISIPTYIGILFGLAGKIYYCNGEVAKVWNLPVVPINDGFTYTLPFNLI